MEKQTRTLKIATEKNLGSRFGVRHPGFLWLIMHAADVLTKCQVLKDGRTAYENIKGRKYTGVMLEFGCVVMHKVESKVEGGVMAPRWIRGIWLGKIFGTDEHIVTMPDGSVVRSPAVKLHAERPWDREFFYSIRGKPWDPSGKEAEDEVLERPGDIPKPCLTSPVVHVPQPRRAHIGRSYLDRKRVEDDPQLKKKIEDAEARQNETLRGCCKIVRQSESQDKQENKKKKSAEEGRQNDEKEITSGPAERKEWGSYEPLENDTEMKESEEKGRRKKTCSG